MKTTCLLSIVFAWLARGLVLGLVVSLAIGLTACDSRNNTASSTDDGGGGVSSIDADCPELNTLTGFTDPPVCIADATASGGDVMCFQACGGATITVTEPGQNVYGYLQIPDDGDPYTNMGGVLQTGSNPEGLSLLIASPTATPGPYSLRRFSGWSGPSYRAIGQSAGEGDVMIDQYDAVNGRIIGQFEAIMCGYADELVQCSLGQMYIKGAFDITRTVDIEGGTDLPF